MEAKEIDNMLRSWKTEVFMTHRDTAWRSAQGVAQPNPWEAESVNTCGQVPLLGVRSGANTKGGRRFQSCI